MLALDVWNGFPEQVLEFIQITGVTFPVLRDASPLITSQYGLGHMHHVVVDATGIVRYTSAHETQGSQGFWNDAAVRGAVDDWLPSTTAAPTTWSRVKALFD